MSKGNRGPPPGGPTQFKPGNDGGPARFQPGQSGNPGGRPRLPEAFRNEGPALLADLLLIARDKGHPDNFDALKWCAERIYGKAQQSVEGEVTVTPAAAALLAMAMQGKKPDDEGET